MCTSYVFNPVALVKVTGQTAYERSLFEGVALAMVNAIARNLQLEERAQIAYTHGQPKTINGNFREVLTLKRFGDMTGDEERNLQIELAIPRDNALLHALEKAHQAARRSLSNRLQARVVFPKSGEQYESDVYTLETTSAQFK